MATTTKARRGWSPEAQQRRASENLSGSLWEAEARLRQLRCVNPWQEQDRRAALTWLAGRTAWGRWVRWDELAARQAEGVPPTAA